MLPRTLALILCLLTFFSSAQLPAYATGPLRATRIFTQTYPCDGASRQVTWRLTDSVSGHAPITAPAITIFRVWGANYTMAPNSTTSRVAAFRDSLDGVSTHGDLLFQLFPGYDQSEGPLPSVGLRLSQQDSITIDYICWGASMQTTAAWVWYGEETQ